MVYFDQTLHTYTYGKEGKDQESIQLYNTPDPGHHIEKFPILCHGSGVLFENMANITYKRAKRSDFSQQVTTKVQHVNISLTTGMHKNLFSWTWLS